MQSVSETKVTVRRPHVVGVGVPRFMSFSSNQNINREETKRKQKKKGPPNLNPSGRFIDNTINNLTVS